MGIANNGPSGLASNFSARRTLDISARTSLHAYRLSVAKLADSLAKKEAALLNAAYRGFPPPEGKPDWRRTLNTLYLRLQRERLRQIIAGGSNANAPRVFVGVTNFNKIHAMV